ncbi:MAG: DUF4252 domain-containing protein [Bacteroidales bacterium]|jgi:hypothetical protein|nr:DUF4252 domain-containing protein [Bacteroidales bacterium]
MKKMVLTVAVVAFTAAVYGQKQQLDEFFNRYSDREGYTTVVISGSLLGLIDNRDDDYPDNPIRKITSIRVVVRERDKAPFKDELLPEIRNIIRRGKYEELMSVRDDDADLRFMVRTERDIIREILLLIDGEDEAVIQIEGNLTRDEASELFESNGKGLAILEELEISGD